MARRGRARRAFSSARSSKAGGIVDGALGGVAAAIIGPIVPLPGVGAIAAGYFLHNSTLQVIGGYELGRGLMAGGLGGLGNLFGGGQMQASGGQVVM